MKKRHSVAPALNRPSSAGLRPRLTAPFGKLRAGFAAPPLFLHRNPVRSGLVEKPEDWKWSSHRHYLTGIDGVVEVESPMLT